MNTNRTATINRNTSETQISLQLHLDGSGQSSISTGIAFFDHMLTALTRHSLVDLTLQVKGDLEVDFHHTVEDTGIALGQAFLKALGDKKGIRRYGYAYVPMDECLSRAVIDFSGRPYLVYRNLDDLALQAVKSPALDVSTQFRFGLMREFMQGFANAAACNLHVERIYGEEPHHVVESIFKSMAKSIDMAIQVDSRVKDIPSTKGKL